MIRTGNEKMDVRTLELPVKAGEEMLEATIAVVNESGYAETATKAESLLVAGCVQKYVDNRNGADGAATVTVRRGAFVWENDGSINATDVLKPCYIAGPTSVTITESGASPAGIILAVDADGVTVDMTQRIAPAQASEAV